MAYKTLYSRASDILTSAASWSVTAGTINSLYPLTNVYDWYAHTVTRPTGTSVTYRGVFGSAQTLQGVALVNTDCTSATLTNSAGLSLPIAIPAIPLDGIPLDPWIDLRLAANTSAATWTIALFGPTGVALGLPILSQSLRQLPVLWGVTEEQTHGTLIQQTDYGVRHKYGFGVRQRVVRCRVTKESYRTDVVALQRDVRGPQRNFLFILDERENDALYVDLTSPTQSILRQFTGVSENQFVVTEQLHGWT